MTQASSRPPSYLQPRPKAVPTFSSTSIAAGSTTTPPQASRHSSKSRPSSPARSARPSDTSDRATAALIRRVLSTQSHGATDARPIHELLPPLTSSNDVDFQLYAIISIVVKELVQSWYGKITPDQGFVEEVVRIVAHCTTQLESRLRNVDLESLVFDEIPELITGHIHAYRIGHRPADTPLSTDPRVIYHNLIPHPALFPVPDPSVPASATEQEGHEAEYRQLLVQGALAVLLPTEDLENACLRTLVADVISDSILGKSIGGKVCEDWFIWGSITKLVEVVKAKIEPRATGEQIEVDTRSRLEKFGLLADKSKDKRASEEVRRSAFSSIFWRVLQYGYLAFISLRFIILGFNASYSLPSRSVSAAQSSSSTESSPIEKTVESHHRPRPLLEFGIFPLVSILLDLSSRMPWLSGSMALFQHHLIHGPLRSGATDGILDQYLHHLIRAHLHPPTLLPQLLSLARQTLFPNSQLPPPNNAATPSPAEIGSSKRTCAIELLELMPPAACRRLFGSGQREVWVGQVEGELGVFGDAYLNRHLAYRILELVVVRVLPEVGEKGVEELMRERIGDM